MEEEYRQTLMDHFRSPRNRLAPAQITHTGNCLNPSCGDFVECQLEIKEGKIENLCVIASGCTMCVASASFASEFLKGQNLSLALEWKNKFRCELEKSLDENWHFTEFRVFYPLRKNPSRQACALLVWEALNQALLKI